jgi:hypothetical protein
MSSHTSSSQVESPYAWARLWVSLALMTVGGSGMYTVSIVLPKIQTEFGAGRGEAALPYTLAMIGFGLGGVLMGRLSDRFGVAVPAVIGAIFLCLGYVTAGSATSMWQFALAQGLLIGLLGTAATFTPLIADTSKWFTRRRGIALAICMSGNYLAGAVWSPVLQHYVAAYGWRQTYLGMGIFCLVVMLPLITVLRRPPPVAAPAAVTGTSSAPPAAAPRYHIHPINLSPAALQSLLCVAGVACCVAMSMPQVHIVAYCGDLGWSDHTPDSVIGRTRGRGSDLSRTGTPRPRGSNDRDRGALTRPVTTAARRVKTRGSTRLLGDPAVTPSLVGVCAGENNSPADCGNSRHAVRESPDRRAGAAAPS